MTVITSTEWHNEVERIWSEYTRDFGRKRDKADYWSNPQKQRDRKTRYRKENPEKIIAQRRKFYVLHREKVKAKARAYKARKRAERASNA